MRTETSQPETDWRYINSNFRYDTPNRSPSIILQAMPRTPGSMRPNLNIVAAVRLEHDSNPVCGTNCYSYTNGTFGSLNTSTATPYSSLLPVDSIRRFLGSRRSGQSACGLLLVAVWFG